MKINALAVANYFIELADRDNIPIRPLGLMKRVYIAHGFSLALLQRSLLDSRFDVVEAWRYGPVIPSVYHTFKYLRDRPITMDDRAVVMTDANTFDIALLSDQTVQMVVQIVWERYKYTSDVDLMEITHQKGSPWEAAYVKNMNRIIPDEYTQLYYSKLLEEIIKDAKSS